MKEETMTPHALLTTIGATAIAFAIAIGAAGGFASNDPASARTMATMMTVERVPHGAVHAAPGTNLAERLRAGAGDRATTSDHDCEIAL
jgi:hypothetical protein